MAAEARAPAQARAVDMTGGGAMVAKGVGAGGRVAARAARVAGVGEGV